MATYTVVVEAADQDQSAWQALAPAENVDGNSAEEVAHWVATNQTLADGANWRVRVWPGANADTGVAAHYEHRND
jgi:hypothetical protein